MSKRQFTIRLEQTILDKMIYISKFNSRSPNKEFEILIKEYIAQFEKTNGKIQYKEDAI